MVRKIRTINIWFTHGKGSNNGRKDDFADVVQTLVNFIDAFDVVPAEIEAAYNRIDKKNVEYGCFKHNERNIFMIHE